MGREYIGAGWRKQTKSGIDCISLKINEDANVRNGENLVLYKTREKKSDASPDFNLCRETRDQGNGGNGGNRNQGNGGGQRPQGNQGGTQPRGNYRDARRTSNHDEFPSPDDVPF